MGAAQRLFASAVTVLTPATAGQKDSPTARVQRNIHEEMWANQYILIEDSLHIRKIIRIKNFVCEMYANPEKQNETY